MRFDRRGLLLAGSALMASAVLSQSARSAQEDDPDAIEKSIKNWINDPENAKYFTTSTSRGSLILAPSDQRVKDAAAFLSKVPKNLAPIETARFIFNNLPPDKRMEWPRDTPGHPRPANPLIIEFFSATNTKPYQGDETAWCAAFACWTLEHSGHKSPRNAGSKAFRNWGKPTANPQVGDMACFVNKKKPGNGHITYFDGWVDAGKRKFWALGGNQGDKLDRVAYGLETKSLKLLHFLTDI